MMKTKMCCSFWILVTAMLVITSGADGAQEKDNTKTLPPLPHSPSRPADLHGAGVHPPHLPHYGGFPGTPDRSPASSVAEDSPPLPDGFPPPDWQEKPPPYPDSSQPPEGPRNVTPEGRDDVQPSPGRLSPKPPSDISPLPAGQRPKWRSSFPSVHDSHQPIQPYNKGQPRLGRHAPKTSGGFPSHEERYQWRHHSDDYPAKEPYEFPSHAGRYPPKTPHVFPPHLGRRPPEPPHDFPPKSPLDYSPRQGRHPPDLPDSFPPLPDTPVQSERDLLSVLESDDLQPHSQSLMPDYSGRQAVFPERPPLLGKRINPEENSHDRGPSSDHVEALLRRTLRREGRKHSRLRKLYKRLQRQKLSSNVQQKNPAWKREPESRAEEKTALDGVLQPFLDRKKAVSFLSRQPPPSKWRKWLNKLFKRDQKTRDQFSDAFSFHHVSHNTGKDDDNDDVNDDDDGNGVTDHLNARFFHGKSYNIDGQGEVFDDWKGSDDKSEEADDDSREETYRGKKTPTENDKPADISDNDYPDNYQRDSDNDANDDSSLGENQSKNHELNKRSNSRKINRKKTNFRMPRDVNLHFLPARRKWSQRFRQHLFNRLRKARGPKNLLPKHKRPNFPKDVLSNTKWLSPRRRVPPNRKKQAAKRPLPSPMKRRHRKRFPERQRFQNRHRTRHRPKSRSKCRRPSPRCSFPSKKRFRGKFNGGRRRKAKWFARRRQKSKKKDLSRMSWPAGNKKKRVDKNDCDDKTPVSSTAKQNPTFTFSTTEPIFPPRGGPTTPLPRTSASISDTTKSPVPPEKDQGEQREGLEPVRTVYLGAVEGSRLEAARVDVFRTGSNRSVSSNSTPVFVRVNYKQQDQPLHTSAAGALERTKRNADNDQGDDGDNESDDDENVNVSDDDIRLQRRNRRRRMQRRRRERKRNRMNRLNRRRRLYNDGDDDVDDISASSEDRQQGRRRGNYQQQRREGINANVREEGNDSNDNDNNNGIEHNNDDDHDDNDVNNNIDQENDNDHDANDQNDSNNNDDHEVATREEIRLSYRRQEREPTAIEVTVHDDENNDEDDIDDRQNRVVGFVHLGSSSRRNRQRNGDSSNHQRNQLINRNRRRRQRRLMKKRQRQQNRQRARQQRASLASSGVRNAGDVSRESEPETPLSQIQAVSSDNGRGQGQQEAEAFIPSPFINHRTAYDFLSTQVRSRSRGEPGRGVNEQQAEQWQFNHRMSESMCEVFDKHFVPTTLGGRCV